MNRNIGIVCEGPTDYVLLKEVVDRITGAENTYMQLQPEDNLKGEYGNGWKGVWKWCMDHGEMLEQFMKNIFPQLDILIVQLDGDVSRKEKEAHCRCETTACELKSTQNPMECVKLKAGKCPVELPCASHSASVEDYIDHLTGWIISWLGKDNDDVCIVIPCDSTDAWIVAAYDNPENAERIEDPWRTVISRGKTYHGIRIHGHNKSSLAYRQFAAEVCSQWDHIKRYCVSARRFEERLKMCG